MQHFTRSEMGSYIRTLRKQFRLNQTQLAEKIGVSKRCIINIESGHTKTRPYILNAVLRYFGVSIDYKIIE